MKWFMFLSLIAACALQLPAQDGQAMASGSFQKMSYFSQETGVERRINVYFPPGYDPAKKYPVLYVLHGIGGSENEWLQNAAPGQILDTVINADPSREMIVVFANGRAMVPDSVPPNIYSATAINAFARFENDLIGSLIPFVETKLNVYTDRTHRAICGLSMGGGQALNFGLGHPKLFGYVGAFSPAPNTDTTAFKVVVSSFKSFIYILCGESDRLLNISQGADIYLSANKVEHQYKVIKGNHEWSVWKFGLREFTSGIFGK